MLRAWLEFSLRTGRKECEWRSYARAVAPGRVQHLRMRNAWGKERIESVKMTGDSKNQGTISKKPQHPESLEKDRAQRNGAGTRFLPSVMRVRHFWSSSRKMRRGSRADRVNCHVPREPIKGSAR